MIHQDRMKKLSDKLLALNIQAFVVEDLTHVFYLTGLDLSSAMIVIEEQEACLFIDNRYFEFCKQHSPIPIRLVDSVSLATVLPRYPNVRTLGFDSCSTSHQKFVEYQAIAGSQGFELVALNDPISDLRVLKDVQEIELLTEAARLGSLGYDYVLTLLTEGVTEKRLAQELEIFWKRKGSKALAFDPIIAFGPNSSMPHYRPADIPLKRGDNVLIDIGVNLKHYHSDMTRVAFFGAPDPRLLDIYAIVREAQEQALAVCRPGIAIGEIDKAARQYITDQGFGDYFTHGLGHGVGLEIHERPWIRNKPPFNRVALEPGMVITIEPGIYLPSIGGIRIEDTVVICPEGYINLTNRSKELVILT